MNKEFKKILGRERVYSKAFEGREDVIRWDVLKIKQEQELELEIISTNSKYVQGIRLAIDAGNGYIEINGICRREFELWEDTMPDKQKILCKSEEGVMSVYNIFGARDGSMASRSSLSDFGGMLVEWNGNTVTYRCNDAGRVTNFDKLVFSITLL